MSKWRIVVVVLAFMAALAGASIGRLLVRGRPAQVNELHHLLYDQLDLTPEQRRTLKSLEHDYIGDKATLERAMRADNAQLARAISREHGYGPEVNAAIDHSHRTMGELQKVTLRHVFAMRAVLSPAQAVRYDRVLVETLTDPNK